MLATPAFVAALIALLTAAAAWLQGHTHGQEIRRTQRRTSAVETQVNGLMDARLYAAIAAALAHYQKTGDAGGAALAGYQASKITSAQTTAAAAGGALGPHPVMIMPESAMPAPPGGPNEAPHG